MSSPIEDPLNDTPPAALEARVANVELDKLATFRFTGDPKDTGKTAWFDTGSAHAVQAGNEVYYLVDGAEAYPEMARVMANATDPQKHFIYMLDWACYSSFPFPTTGSSSTLRDTLTDADKRGVQICLLAWAAVGADRWGWFSPRAENAATVSFINSLTNGQAFMDGRLLDAGSHHQKVLVVFGSEGGADTLTAFVGGIDFNPDRLFPKGTAGAGQAGGPMHDVHCRVRGPAAADILQTFVERWTDSDVAFALDGLGVPKPLRGSAMTLASSAPGRLDVQIARTYGNGTAHPITHGTYGFAPSGEKTIQAMMLKAIRAATRYIYIEDQYLVNMATSRALVAALPNIKHLTILIPHPKLSDMPGIWARRKAFIAPLRQAGGSKVRVMVRSGWQSQQSHSYVHAKTWVFDDRFAVIGSANVNLRGWTHDSEIVVGVFDQSTNDYPSFTFAHRLRIKLWAEHLNMTGADNYALLADPIASAKYWFARRTFVEPYDENSGSDVPNPENIDALVDPDGS
jgi:phosphatidylserine/phosphatidylglycerophosphate/cardiolipin synthase-like enzyme